MDIIPIDERCNFCRKRATKLCDYPVGHWVSPHMIAKVGKIITCSRQICDDCATNLGYETDFCPKCMDLIRELKAGKQEVE
jgi:hypothetical protein